MAAGDLSRRKLLPGLPSSEPETPIPRAADADARPLSSKLTGRLRHDADLPMRLGQLAYSA